MMLEQKKKFMCEHWMSIQGINATNKCYLKVEYRKQNDERINVEKNDYYTI